MIPADQNTLNILMMAAWLGEAATLLPLSRCRHTASALLCLLVVAIGQLLCSASLSAQQQWPVVFGSAAVLAGLLQVLSWLLLLPAVFLCGFATSITLSSLMAAPLWWLIVSVCGAQRWLQCDSWETLTAVNLSIGLSLCAIGCAVATVLVGWKVKAACRRSATSELPAAALTVQPCAPPPFVSSIRSYMRAPPSRLRMVRYPTSLSLDLSTASPTLSDVSSPTGSDSPWPSLSSSFSSSVSYSSPLRFLDSLPSEWHSSPSRSPFSQWTDDMDETDPTSHSRRYYDSIALETEDSDDEQKDDRHSERNSRLSDIATQPAPLMDVDMIQQHKHDEQVVLPASPSAPFPSATVLYTPTARIAAAAVCCLSSAVCQSTRLLPLYADSKYGLERQQPMGQYMIGMSVTNLVCLVLVYGVYSVSQAGYLASPVNGAEGSIPSASTMRRSPSATRLLPGPATTAAVPVSAAASMQSLLLSPLPCLFPVYLCLLAGAASALSFAFFHQLLQMTDYFDQFGWYSTDFPNDHYSPITALAPGGLAAMSAAFISRVLDDQRGSGEVGGCRLATVWIIAILLGSLGNFWMVSNGLIKA